MSAPADDAVAQLGRDLDSASRSTSHLLAAAAARTLVVDLSPSRVTWTDHALVKAATLGLARDDVERTLLEEHHARTRNTGAAEWRLLAGPLVLVYDYPDGDDSSAARLVTLWRRR